MAGLTNNNNPIQSQVRLGPQAIQLIPGPQGPAGQSAVAALTTANYTQPAVGGTVSVAVNSTTPFAAGLGVFVNGGGYYTVQSITDGTHMVLVNLGSTVNSVPTTVVTLGELVVPTGPPSPSLTVTSNGAAITQRAILDLNELVYVDDAGGGRMRFYGAAFPNPGAAITTNTTLTNLTTWLLLGAGTYTLLLPAVPIVGVTWEMTDVVGSLNGRVTIGSVGSTYNITDPQLSTLATTCTLTTDFVTYRFRFDGTVMRCVN